MHCFTFTGRDSLGVNLEAAPPLKTLMHVYIGQLKRRVLIECPLLNSVRTTDRTACRQ